MDLRLFFTKRKILALILICLLISICYIIARRTSIINEPVPLSSTNIEAMFYVENSESGSVTCVGDGLINSTEETSGQDAVGSKIVTAPDQSAYLGNSQTISWSSIRNVDGEYRVYGKAVESTKVPSNSISVRDFGAIGDGVTDDTNALQTAITNGVGKKVYFPSGTYVISNKLRIPSNTELIGDDANNTIILAKEGTKRGATLIIIQSATNVSLQNISLSGNSSVNYEGMNSSGGIILLTLWDSGDIHIKNCAFIDNISLAIQDINTSNVTVEECNFKDTDCGFITLGNNNIHDLTIKNNVFDGHKSSEPISMFATANHTNILIENNTISNKYYGCGILVAGKAHNDNITIVNNTINACAGGIRVNNTSNSVLLNNTVTSTSTGSAIKIYDCDNLVLDNNTCQNASMDGLEINNCSQISISNLTTINCGQRGNEYFNVRFSGTENKNITLTDSTIEYNDRGAKIGICFNCDTDITMNDIDYNNATIWLTKNSSNTSLTVPESVKVRDNGQANTVLKY